MRRFALSASLLALAVLLGAGCSDRRGVQGADIDVMGTTPATRTPAGEPAPAGDDPAAGSSELVQRPEPTEAGDFGSFTWNAEYGAITRSCRQTFGDAPDTLQTFEVVDGQTKNTLHVTLATQNGSDYGVDVYAFGDDPDAPPIASGTATAEDGDAERTNGEGTFANGDPFTFSLVLVGSTDC